MSDDRGPWTRAATPHAGPVLAIAALQVVSAFFPATGPDVELAAEDDLFFGRDIAAYGDWDSDGRDDYLVTAPRMWDDARYGPTCSRVFLVSGRDASAPLARGFRSRLT